MISIRLESFRDFIDQYGPRISEEGIFLVTDAPPSPGETVEFELGLADDFRLLHGRGEVVWRVEAGQDPEHPAGAAIRFLETDESSRRLITRIVHQQRERGEAVFDLGEAPAAEKGAGEEPFGVLPEPEVGLFDGLQFDLVEQGDFGASAAPGAAAPAGPDGGARTPLLEPDLPGAASEIELPAIDLEPPAAAAVDRGTSAQPPPALDEVAAPRLEEEAAAAEPPGWVGPPEEPAGPGELLQMPDLAAIADGDGDGDGDGEPAEPPETGPLSEGVPLPRLERVLKSAERATPAPPPVPLELPRPVVRPEAESRRRPSRWGWIAAIAGVVAVAALGLGAYLEGDALKAWLGLAPPSADAPRASATAPTVAPEEEAVAEPESAPPAAPAEPAATAPPAPPATQRERAAAAPAAFRNVEEVTWQQEPGRTVVIVATDGTVSTDRVEVLRIEQGDPRVVIKLLGVERPLPQSTIAVGTAQVRQIRAGLHSGARGQELHLVADLTGPDVRPAGIDARGSEFRLTLSSG